MVKIMFVCHGNICRSPMAEFIFKKMVAERGLSAEFEIRSSATSAEEITNGIGKPVYPAARAELEKHGIVPKAALATKAIPNCNLTYIDGADMKPAISGYFEVLFAANKTSVGGALPDENFYYVP